jgi:acyl-CoA synthetase (AMP-forming)/AMP-acid ligase II
MAHETGGDTERSDVTLRSQSKIQNPKSKITGEPQDLSPTPLLDLVENYAGSILDFDRNLTVDGPALRACRDELASALVKLGIKSGERILFRVGNGPGFVAGLAAVLSVGASPVLLHFETPPAELDRLAVNYGANYALCENWIASNATGTHSATPLRPGSWDQIACVRIETEPSATERLPRIPSVPLHPTSGTTGTPKVAVRHTRAAIAEAANYQETMNVTADDTIFCAVPMSHSYGFGAGPMLTLVSGARLVSCRRFNPHHVLQACARETITLFPSVPAMLHLLLVAAGAPVKGLPRRILSAGAPLPEQTARAFSDKMRQTISALYGSTETGGISVDIGSEPDGGDGCVGPPMRAVSVRISPMEESAALKEVVGRVAVKLPSMMAGYLSEEGIDDSCLADGWFLTGDLGFLDERRRVHLVGRESDVINVFGLKVIPSEVEEVILDFGSVTDVKVYAGRHRSGSQIVKAAVAGPKSLDIAALREHCAKQLVGYKRPEVITHLEALPRTPTGKIIADRLP